MQRQLKTLDDELQLNNLVRIQDPIPKTSNSFFRALSISLYSHHHQTQPLKSLMKLTLEANCNIFRSSGPITKMKRKQQIPFPLVSQSSQLIKKFVNNKQMLQMYSHSPDLQCFQNDNYQLTSYTFNKRVSIFHLNKEGYLNQMLISCCRNKTGKKIMFAKLGKRYFAVQKQSTKLITVFIREYLLGNVINQIIIDELQNENKQNTKIHFAAYDQIIINSNKKFPKAHKKSLSDCGDNMKKLQQFRAQYIDQDQKAFHTNIKNIYDSIQNRSHQEEPKNLLDSDREFDFCQKQIGKQGEQMIYNEHGNDKQRQTQNISEERPDQNQDKLEQKNDQNSPLRQIEVNVQQKGQQIKDLEQENTGEIVITDKVISDNVISDNVISDNVISDKVPQQFKPINSFQQKNSQLTEIVNQEENNQVPIIQYTITQEAVMVNNIIQYDTKIGSGYSFQSYQQSQSYQGQGYYSPQQQYTMYPGYQMNPQYYNPDYTNYYNMHALMYQQNPYYHHQYYQQPQQHQYPCTQQQQQQLVQNNRYRGRLKFYDNNGKYGFIIVDTIGSDLFVHFDDLSKAGITKQQLQAHSSSRQLRFQFTYYQYQGKNKKAKKAIDLVLISELV